jgi:hypothetical protein
MPAKTHIAGSEPHLCSGSGILGPPASPPKAEVKAFFLPASRRDRLEACGPRPCALLQRNLSETALCLLARPGGERP